MFTFSAIEKRSAADLLGRLTAQLKSRGLERALRLASKPVADDARERIPAPGYPGDDPDKVPLRETLKVVIRTYPDYYLAVTGTSWPEGAHGHLVEFGHIAQTKTGALIHVAPKPWLRPAIDTHRSNQTNNLLIALKAFTAEVTG